jgi:hypothetical protein
MKWITGFMVVEDKARYYISQGRTISSSIKNFYKYGKRLGAKHIQIEPDSTYSYPDDIYDLISLKFSKQWCNGDYWGEKYPSVCFPRANCAGVVEIPEALFEDIMSVLHKQIVEQIKAKAANREN